ncbi:MAG: sodium:alanine symporter family protein [Bacteroidia bacterium]
MEFLTSLKEFIMAFSSALWGWGPGDFPLLVIFLLGTGLLLTALTGAVQFRKFGTGVKLVLGGAFKNDDSKEGGDISPFQALMTSLSATVGNGNIAGVATAIALGGPGAVFWMWITGLLGMATKYAEAVLGVRYRITAEDGSTAGGPMYYCEKGIGGRFGKFLGVFFAVAGVIACLIGTGNMFQANSIATSFASMFNTLGWVAPENNMLVQGVVGAMLALLVGAVILGGVNRIGNVAEKLVPTMIGLYFLSAIVIILMNVTAIPEAILIIVESAFTPKGVLGGAVGIGIMQAIRFGVARGVLSNESGLGSAPIAHAAAKAESPVKQGQIAMMGTFIDTLVVCTLTALVITVTGAYKMGPLFVEGEAAMRSIDMTMHAFNSAIPNSSVMVMIGSFLFGFSTLLGWSYYGEKCSEYLFGSKVKTGYRLLFIAFLFVGSLPTAEGISAVVAVGDIGNALMAVPNLIALVMLAREVGRITMSGDPGWLKS